MTSSLFWVSRSCRLSEALVTTTLELSCTLTGSNTIFGGSSFRRCTDPEVKQGKRPRRNEHFMTAVALISTDGLQQTLQISPITWLLLRGWRHLRNKPWEESAVHSPSLVWQGKYTPVLGQGNSSEEGNSLIPYPCIIKVWGKLTTRRSCTSKSQVSMWKESVLAARKHRRTWIVMLMLCTSDWLKPSLT